jgi:hypothetical protein
MAKTVLALIAITSICLKDFNAYEQMTETSAGNKSGLQSELSTATTIAVLLRTERPQKQRGKRSHTVY